MGLCREIYQEGLRIPQVKIVQAGELNRPILQLILHNVRPPGEREGDLMSQIGACRVGEARLQELIEKYGAPLIRRLSGELLDYSERLMRAELAKMSSGTVGAEDFLDNDGFGTEPIRIQAAIRFNATDRSVVIDFAGSTGQVESSINAGSAVTYSAVYYVFRCLLPEDAPATAGLMRPLTVVPPSRSIVNSVLPAPVAGGNRATSQPLVGVVL